MLPTYRQNIIETLNVDQITNIHKLEKATAYNYELELKLK